MPASAMPSPSHSSSTVSPHAAALSSASQLRFVTGPYSMREDGAAEPNVTMGSESDFSMAPSTFPFGFYETDNTAHLYQCDTVLREAPGRGTGFQQGACSAAHLYGGSGRGGGSGFSRTIVYGSPSDPRAAACNASVSAAGFGAPHFGPVYRTNSAATSGTALSECHLSRKDGGGFTSASARTFLRSDDSFGSRSGNSIPSLPDSLVTPPSYMSCPVEESVGSAYYLNTACGEKKQDDGLSTHSAEGALVLHAAQRPLSSSAHVASRGAASPLSSENSFSMMRRADLVGRVATASPPTLPMPPPAQRPEISAAQNGKLGPRFKRNNAESDALCVAVRTDSSASESLLNGLGPTGCSPFYDLSSATTESPKADRRPSAASHREDVRPTTATARRSERGRLPSGPRRPAGDQRGNAHSTGSASASSTSSIATSAAPRQRSLLAETMSTASTESKETISSLGSVGTSKPPAGRSSPSATRKPRRKDPRKAHPSRSTSIAAAHAADGEDTAPVPSSPMPITNAAGRTQTATASPFSRASPARCERGVTRCQAAVASQPPQALRQQWNPTSAPKGSTPAFMVAPPSHDERHPRPFLRRRYLRGHVTPLSATEVQMAMVPFSPRRDVPPSRHTVSGPSPKAPPKTTVPPPPSQHDQISLPGTAQPWSPNATASSSASFSVTPEKFITVASGAGARRTQQRLAGFAGFHLSLGVEGMCVAAENSNERSLRSLGARSGTETRMLGESSTGIMSRSCPSVEYSVDEGTHPFLIQRSSSWSVHSARSTTDSGEVSGIARKKRQTERMLSTAQEVEDEYVTVYPKPSR
ncbi:hypothetical protein LSCM1_01549 [Leishmania martiniquensis]|uniref:Uncharacterized protein n=1 Tax=Leishmania martiniquensis TaxID=1580590 RepID=A0A836H6T1_9TRYP|nr:hypothetical protein LSCM1_01549 [Leishmania martiniquensis]